MDEEFFTLIYEIEMGKQDLSYFNETYRKKKKVVDRAENL